MSGMTYDEFKRHLGKANLSAKEFAGLLRLSPNSVTNYARTGDVPAHLAVIAALMGEMADHRLDFKPVLATLDIEPNKRRGTGFGASRQISLQLQKGS